MSPTTILFFVVVGIYLLDCVLLAPEDAVVLSERNGGWKNLRSGVALGALRKRAVLAGALAPGRTAVVLPQWPLALSPQGISWRDAQGVLQCLSYDALTALSSNGPALRLTEDAVIAVHSTSRARQLVSVLAKLRNSREPERAALIDNELTRALDVDAAKERWETYRAASTPLRAVGIFLFIHLFVGWPLLIAWLGPNKLWPYVLAELVALVVLTAWQFVHVHRQLYARGSLDVAELVSLTLSPPAAVRATTVLARDLFGGFHPMAVAGAICSSAEFTVLASSLVRDLKYRVEHGESSDGARAVQNWFGARHAAAVGAVASRVLSGQPLPNSPAPESARSRAYCPRCWTQYGTAEGACHDCGGLALMPFTG